jgi:hypothetical protein
MQDYAMAQNMTLHKFQANLQLLLDHWKGRTKDFKDQETLFPTKTPIRKTVPFPEAETGSLHLRFLHSATDENLDFITTAANLAKREIVRLTAILKIKNPQDTKKLEPLEDDIVGDCKKLISSFPVNAFVIAIPANFTYMYAMLNTLNEELDLMIDSVSKATLYLHGSSFLKYGIKEELTPETFRLPGEKCAGFEGFRPEKPLQLDFLLAQEDLKGNKLSHYNTLPRRKRKLAQLRYEMDWCLELCGTPKVGIELDRLQFHLEPLGAVCNVTIRKLKQDAAERAMAKLAVKQGRTRTKNVRRLEKKTSEEAASTPTTPAAAGEDVAFQEMAKMKKEMDEKMNKMQQALNAAQANGNVSGQFLYGSTSSKQSYYDKKKGDKGGTKGDKGRKGDKGEKGKGKGKNDKGKGKKK